MNILISGASGLIGTALRSYLEHKGHQVYILHRGRSSGRFYWQPENKVIHIDDSIPIDAVINLNGVNIGEEKWSDERKQAIYESRIHSTQLLSEALAKRHEPPSVFISASAIGYYGDTKDHEVDEQHSAGNNYLSDIAIDWEAATEAAQKANIRTVHIRSGVVLSAQGGALKKMLTPFKLALGGKLGKGTQYMSWISLKDEIRAIEFLLDQQHIFGPVNLTAPNPVTNLAFTKALSKQLSRPALFPLPAWLIKVVFGEMGQLLLLDSNRVLPNVLKSNGFKFEHKTIEDALAYSLNNSG